MAYGKRFVSFAWAGGTISVSIYDGQYPNYQQVIPVSSATDLTLERAPFMAAVKTAANVAKDAANVIRFTINGTLKVEASSDTGDVSEEVPAEISGDAIRIGLNAASSSATWPRCPTQTTCAGAQQPAQPQRHAPQHRR